MHVYVYIHARKIKGREWVISWAPLPGFAWRPLEPGEPCPAFPSLWRYFTKYRVLLSGILGRGNSSSHDSCNDDNRNSSSESICSSNNHCNAHAHGAWGVLGVGAGGLSIWDQVRRRLGPSVLEDWKPRSRHLCLGLWPGAPDMGSLRASSAKSSWSPVGCSQRRNCSRISSEEVQGGGKPSNA